MAAPGATSSPASVSAKVSIPPTAEILSEAGVRVIRTLASRRQAQRLSGLVQCAQAEIMAALDIDGRQVHSIRRINQQVPQAIDKLRVQRICQVARQVPK